MNTKRIVGCKFYKQTKDTTYTYFTTDPNIVVGDFCVVQVNDEYKVVKVVETEGLTEFERGLASKWIIQRVELAAYEEELKRQKLVQEIRNKLNARKRDMEDMILYQQLAAIDPEIGKLLDRLAELDPSMVPALPAPKRTLKRKK